MRFTARNMLPRYSPIMPITSSCTPASTSTATMSDAQPWGGLSEMIASTIVMAAASAPRAPKTRPRMVAPRSGITEKLRNIASHRRSKRRSV